MGFLFFPHHFNKTQTKIKQSINNELIFLYHQMKQKIFKEKRRIELWQN